MSIRRIEVYLGEEEVPDEVSSLKCDHLSEHRQCAGVPEGPGLGLDGATLRWNEVEGEKENETSSLPATTSISSTTTAVAVSTPSSGITEHGTGSEHTLLASDLTDLTETESLDKLAEDHHFELRDISVMFPERKLSVVTGPTAR